MSDETYWEESRRLLASANTLSIQTQAFAIVDAEGHKAGLFYLNELANVERAAIELFRQPKAKAFEAHKAVCAAEKSILDPIKATRGRLSTALLQYETAERQRAEREQREREAAAKKIAEQEALAAAAAAEEAGDPEAMTILDEALSAPPPAIFVEPQITKIPGVHDRTVWSGVVIDKMALVQFVATHPEYEDLLDVNQSALNRWARAQRALLNIPGVKAEAKTIKIA